MLKLGTIEVMEPNSLSVPIYHKEKDGTYETKILARKVGTTKELS